MVITVEIPYSITISPEEESEEAIYATIEWQGEDELKEAIERFYLSPLVIVLLPDIATYLYVKNTYWLPKNFTLAIKQPKPIIIKEEKGVWF